MRWSSMPKHAIHSRVKVQAQSLEVISRRGNTPSQLVERSITVRRQEKPRQGGSRPTMSTCTWLNAVSGTGMAWTGVCVYTAEPQLTSMRHTGESMLQCSSSYVATCQVHSLMHENPKLQGVPANGFGWRLVIQVTWGAMGMFGPTTCHTRSLGHPVTGGIPEERALLAVCDAQRSCGERCCLLELRPWHISSRNCVSWHKVVGLLWFWIVDAQ